MSFSQILLVVVSGLGVIHGLFLAVFLWIHTKGNTKANRILSVLLMVLSFRIGKSVFLVFAEHLDVKIVFVGLAMIMAIGPLFYFFTRACLEKTFSLSRSHALHFLPAFSGIVFGFWLNESLVETLPKFIFLLVFVVYYLHYLVYLLVSYFHLSRHRKAGMQEDTHRLLRLLMVGLLAIWAAYVLNLFDDLIPYVIGPVLYSVVAYVISFRVIRKGYINKLVQTKYKTTPTSDEQIDSIYARLQRLMDPEKQYRNSNISLKSLSESLHVSPQILSMVINQKSKKNFNGFINHYRIEEAKTLLQDTRYQHQTISSIAFEVGFNSISSFNAAFKNHTGNTPMACREKALK